MDFVLSFFRVLSFLVVSFISLVAFFYIRKYNEVYSLFLLIPPFVFAVLLFCQKMKWDLGKREFSFSRFYVIASALSVGIVFFCFKKNNIFFTSSCGRNCFRFFYHNRFFLVLGSHYVPCYLPFSTKNR